MKTKIIFNNIINLDIDFFLKPNIGLFFIKGKFGVIFIYLPKYYFYFITLNKMNFIFLNKWFFSTFLKQFFCFYKIFYKMFFFRIKLKGLGYRIKKITSKLYRFFIAYNHYIYFYVCSNIFIWTKKRNLLAVSFDKMKLNDLFSHLLLLKKMDFREKTNAFIVPKKILYIKK